jgi:hypothetical protein
MRSLLDRLQTYVQQKVIKYTLRAASTHRQKLAEEAKLRVHDYPPKRQLLKPLIARSGVSTSVRRIGWWTTNTVLAQARNSQ